ncbi:MAG: restriction endonuclease [Burkholderiales bacterium]|nr:restriction endonuclease [Burkholderiales bacterium]
MAENSLFAILLRKPWWISVAIAAVVSLLARALLPADLAVAGMLGSFPFVVIAAMAAWRQRNAPNAAQREQLLQRLQAMNAREFAALVEAAWRSQGFEVRPLKGGGADLALDKGGQLTLMSLRRWKAASTGVEPLRELQAAREQQQADAAIYLAGGEVSDKARSYAREAGLRLIDAPELLQLLHASGVLRKA